MSFYLIVSLFSIGEVFKVHYLFYIQINLTFYKKTKKQLENENDYNTME